jgi:hypothetical protein
MKRLSNWLIGIWLSLCSLIQFWPDAMVHVWAFMPDDLKAAIPPIAVKAISYSILIASLLGKMHGMKKENKALKDDSGNSQG